MESLLPSTASSPVFRLPPTIRFLGVFDTIKALSPDHYDIAFNSSIRHFRHALALHEDRRALSPECIYPEELDRDDLRERGRSFVQAWFIGSHADMGGASPKAGLGLYPLQWMLLEAETCGLSSRFEGSSSNQQRSGGRLRDCLATILPEKAYNKDSIKSTFTASNGIMATMYDLRQLHDQPEFRTQYGVSLTARHGSIRAKRARIPFDMDGNLHGFCDFAAQGTVIHPSVYLLLDERIHIALDTNETKLQRNVEDWRERMLGTRNGHVNCGFWGREDNAQFDLGAIRVLVCGNTGVGKSTLINKTFGVEVTGSSNRTRGMHDVKREITFEGRPDLIVHDSGGFEAGAETELHAISDFMRERAEAVDIRDRLHVIWLCVEITSSRTLQSATEKLFQAVSKHASDVPIVVVATKKDDYLDIEFSAKRKELKKNKQPYDENVCEEYAEGKLRSRLDEIRAEMESLAGGRLNAVVAVSHGKRATQPTC